MTLATAVLQARRAVLVQHLAHHLEDVLLGDRLDVGHAAGERDHLGTGRHGEQRPDLRRGHPGRAMGVEVDESIDGELGHGKALSLASAQVRPSEASAQYPAVTPHSTGRHTPVIGAAWSEARNATAAAISSARMKRARSPCGSVAFNAAR